MASAMKGGRNRDEQQGHLMRSFVVAALIAAASIYPARAKTLSKLARSGEPTQMYQYGNWDADCSSGGGVVKVLTKPQHGRLMPKRESVLIKRSRFTGFTRCAGKTINGFVVYYTSNPGFRGVDTFVIEVSYPQHLADVDSFSVTVD